jgi:hypothetical protein
MKIKNATTIVKAVVLICSLTGAGSLLAQSNTPPSLAIVSPPNGASFFAPANIPICAAARSSSNSIVTQVQFFAGTNSIGVVTNHPGWGGPGPGPGGDGFCMLWTNVGVGAYALTAISTDNHGSRATSAPVNITVVARTNIPPMVQFDSPRDGSVFYSASATIRICADARDPDGTVQSVQFFAGTNSLGLVTSGSFDDYCLTWSNVPPGSYSLTAVATDNSGAKTASSAVNITVTTNSPPPMVAIASPFNGQRFFANSNIRVCAEGRDPDGYIHTIQFFSGTNSLGTVTNTPIGTNTTPPLQANLCLTWSNVPPGAYTLSAVAMDDGGVTATSGLVSIMVVTNQPPPPQTNHNFVNIVATDPIAIESTNCWVWTNCTDHGNHTFTNCGPKNATFTVRRGGTNGALAVAYSISGSASNGADYVTLPGSVTIPDGQRLALITVVPLDDLLPDSNKTVVLTLTQPTNVPPAYTVGFPSRAAAVIIDDGGFHPPKGLLSDGSFHMSRQATAGALYRIEYSADMVNWTAICTNTAINGTIDFVDPDAKNNPVRFYRAVPDSGIAAPTAARLLTPVSEPLLTPASEQ